MAYNHRASKPVFSCFENGIKSGTLLSLYTNDRNQALQQSGCTHDQNSHQKFPPDLID